MNNDTFIGLVNNAALLLALAVLHETLPLKKRPSDRANEILTGILLGFIGMAIMLTPWRFSAGVSFDTRSILLSITGLFFGMIPTLIAAAMTCALRIAQGGSGAFMGIGVLLTSASLGLIWRYLLRFRNKTPRWYSLYGFGVIVHAAMLLWILALPPQLRSDVFKNISLPVMLIYPPGTVLLGLLLIRQRQQNEMEQELRQERDLIAQISETSLDAILLTSPNGSIEAANPAACRMFGLSREEIIQSRRDDILDTADPRLPLALEERNRTGKFIGELVFIHKDGRKFPGEIASALFSDKEGRERSSMIIRDITERKQAEDRIAKEHENFLKIFAAAPVGLLLLDQETTIVQANQATADIVLRDPVDIIGKRGGGGFACVHSFDDPRGCGFGNNCGNCPLRKGIEGILAGSPSIHGAEIEVELLLDGKPQSRWLSVGAEPVEIDGKKCVVVAIDDISMRKQAEDKLRLQGLVLDQIHDCVTVTDLRGRITYVNDAESLMLKRSKDELIGQSVMLYGDDPLRGTAQADIIKKTLSQGKWRGEVINFAADGTEIILDSRTQLVMDPTGKPIAMCGIATDITERKQAEKVLTHSRDLMSYIIEHSRSAVAVHDKDMKYIYVSQRYLVDYKVKDKDVIGKHHYDVFPDLPRKWRDIHQRALKGEVLSAEDDPYVREDGSVDWTRWECRPWYEVEGSIGGIIVYTEVITERKLAEEKLRESEEKFEVVFQDAPVLISISDLASGRYMDVNEEALRASGFNRDEVIGHISYETGWITFEDRARLVTELKAHGMIDGIEMNFHKKDGSTLVGLVKGERVTIAGRDCLLTVTVDITERKYHEYELQAIATLSAALRTASTRAEMLPVIVQQIVSLINCDSVIIEIIEEQSGDAIVEAAHGSWEPLVGSHQVQGTGLNAIISQTLKPYFTQNMEADANLPHPEWARQGIQGCAGIPLIAHELLVGFIWIGRKNIIVEAESGLLSAIADIAANAIHRATLHEQTQRDAAKLALAYDTTLEGWARALELRDQETEGHTRRVVKMTLELARMMGVAEGSLEDVRRGALLHDIGKMGIPDAVLLKPGKLNEREWETMRRHPEYAFNLLNQIEYLRSSLDIPYCHHEKWDGSGYPRQLSGEAIPFPARIFAIVDVWDALTSDRPYRPAWSLEDAVEYMRQQRGKHFDPNLVDAFLKFITATAYS